MTIAALPGLSSEPPDADLLTAAAGGDRRAFAVLVCRHIDLVFAAATRQCGDRHMAEDVTQAVFLVLEKKAGSVRAGALPAWLHQTTRYAAANALRTARRRMRHERAAARSELTMSSGEAEPSDLLPQLDDAIAALGAKDRQVVIGRYLQGLDAPRLAESLNTTPAGVQKRLERALVKMRAYFVSHSGSSTTLAITTTAVAAALAAVAPSPATAAPPALAAATASPAALATARGVLSSLALAKLKMAAVVALSAATLGGASVLVIRHGDTPEPPATAPVVAAAAPQSTPSIGPIGQLRSGVTIALLGVSTNPSYKKQWWQADGTPMDLAPYAQGPGTVTRVRSGRVAREFAFLCDQPNLVTDSTFVVSTPDSEGDSLNGGIDRFGRSIPNVIADASDVPDQPATVRLSLATGPWKTDLSVSASGGVYNDGQLRIGPARSDQDATTVDVFASAPHFVPGTVRVIIIDRAGVEHVSHRSHLEADVTGPKKSWLEVFEITGVPVPDVRQLRLESRPYDQWVEFHSVSLHAGQATQITVKTSDDAVQ